MKRKIFILSLFAFSLILISLVSGAITITITAPSNNTWYTTARTILNYTLNDTTGVDCWYSLDEGSVNSTAVACGVNFSSLTATENSDIWSVFVNNSLNEVVRRDVTFYQDTQRPNITINFPSNITNHSRNNIQINYTVIDTNLQTVRWSNNSGTTNWYFGNGVNITNQTWQQNWQTITFWANDTAGNVNQTSVYFYIDSIFPLVTINQPSEATEYTTPRQEINISVNEDSSCLFTLNQGLTNLTFDANGSRTGYSRYFDFSSGQIVLTTYCNDTLNNLNNTVNVSFTIVSLTGAGGGAGYTPAKKTSKECKEYSLNENIKFKAGEINYDLFLRKFGENKIKIIIDLGNYPLKRINPDTNTEYLVQNLDYTINEGELILIDLNDDKKNDVEISLNYFDEKREVACMNIQEPKLFNIDGNILFWIVIIILGFFVMLTIKDRYS